MGMYKIPEIFQEKISKLFEVFDIVHVCVDNDIIITKENFTDLLKALGKVLKKLTEALLNINAEKSLSGKTETKHLVFWVRKNGVLPYLPNRYHNGY